MKTITKRLVLLFLCLSMAMSSVATVQAKTYYSPSELGLKHPNVSGHVFSLKGNKLTYNTAKYVRPTGTDENYIKASKKKTAKVTSKTKYYVGNIHQFNSHPAGMKYVRRVSKAEFKNSLKDNYSYWDQVVIKNGKVVKVAICMQLAG